MDMTNGQELHEKLIRSGGVLRKNRNKTVYIEVVGEIVAKQCTKCNTLTEIKDFAKDKNCLAGVSSRCKVCTQNMYIENSEYHKRRTRRWREQNTEHLFAYNKKYYEENIEKCREFSRNYQATDKAKRRRIKVRRENAERYRISGQKYRNENLQTSRGYVLKRRAKNKLLPNNLTSSEYGQTLNYFNNSCALSGRSDGLHADHVIPLSIGHGGTTHGNMIPLISEINISKSASNIYEWFTTNKERFNLEQSKFDRMIEYLADINEVTVEDYRDHVYWCHENPTDLTEDDESEAV